MSDATHQLKDVNESEHEEKEVGNKIKEGDESKGQ